MWSGKRADCSPDLFQLQAITHRHEVHVFPADGDREVAHALPRRDKGAALLLWDRGRCRLIRWDQRSGAPYVLSPEGVEWCVRREETVRWSPKACAAHVLQGRVAAWTRMVDSRTVRVCLAGVTAGRTEHGLELRLLRGINTSRPSWSTNQSVTCFLQSHKKRVVCRLTMDEREHTRLYANHDP